MANLESGGFLFYSNFDSGNLAKVELVPRSERAVISINKNGKDIPEIPDVEFNVWTKPDCSGTEFENGNRTWFYFGVKGYLACALMKINLVDLNRQAKMFSQGMAPVYKIIPGRTHWERIRDRPTYTVNENIFTLSFKFKTPENIDAIMFFAFTYPYTYTELLTNLISIDQRFLCKNDIPSIDDIYYVRECVCKSLENRRIDLITISSYYNITSEKELRLTHLFPDIKVERPYKFKDKKVIFISARVHPGETPSSFVFNGVLNFLLNREDPHACALRRMYVFKMIPFLNPDGVYRGHYRTDTRGVNLNRMYLSPTLAEHPSIYAARALIQYYHNGLDLGSYVEVFDNKKMMEKVQVLSLDEKQDSENNPDKWAMKWQVCETCERIISDTEINSETNENICAACLEKRNNSGLFLYLDMHGHASKKGIFIYGNHFDDPEKHVECMLLPKIISLNNHNFHFNACNFTERNMYLKDRRDGMSREGSGRVAVLKLTGLVRSYTLECNYNSGRIVNVLPPLVKEGPSRTMHTLLFPPKYNPHIFEEVGKSIAISILDLTGHNPNSRLPNSEFRTLTGLREWLSINCMTDLGFGFSKLRNKASANQNKSMRSKPSKTFQVKPRNMPKINKKAVNKSNTIPVARKENISHKLNSNTQNNIHSASSSNCRLYNRSNKLPKGFQMRVRPKREINQKSKTHLTNQDNLKLSSRSVQTSNTSINELNNETEIEDGKETPKRLKVVTPPEEPSDRLKLREICFIKEKLTKKIIAKFTSADSTSSDGHNDDDDLVVAWDRSFSPKIITKQKHNANVPRNVPRVTPRVTPRKHIDSASTSKQNPRGSFITVKTKRIKTPFRRLTSANMESAVKIDRMKKRKKLKTKLI